MMRLDNLIREAMQQGQSETTALSQVFSELEADFKNVISEKAISENNEGLLQSVAKAVRDAAKEPSEYAKSIVLTISVWHRRVGQVSLAHVRTFCMPPSEKTHFNNVKEMLISVGVEGCLPGSMEQALESPLLEVGGQGLGLVLKRKGYRTKGSCRDLLVDGVSALLRKWMAQEDLEHAIKSLGDETILSIEKTKYDR